MKVRKRTESKWKIGLLAGIILLAASTSCRNTGTVKTEKVEGTEWNVTVNKVVAFNDSVLGIGTDYGYTVADTARVNAGLKDVPHCGNTAVSWTIPSADGSIWLVAYDNEPLLSEKVTVTEVNSMPNYGGDVQVAFRFPDAGKWEAITAENIGQRLAVTVNGQLMNAPQVNSAITSGNCSVSIPADIINDYLPDLDLSKLK